MLTVKSIFDVVANVDLVNDLVSIFLKRCREDYDLIVLGHSLDELDATRPNEEKAIILILNIVDERFIKIEHERVRSGLLWLKWVQERWGYLWQIGEVVREDSCACRCDG